MNELEKLLDAVFSACRTARDTDLSQYVDQDGERLKLYKPIVNKLMNALKVEIDKQQIRLGNSYGQLMAFADIPKIDKDNIVEAIRVDSNRAEIRGSLKNMEREDALNLIEQKTTEEICIPF